ncbi:hypothetical protein SAMN05421507_103396 [Lentzea jiangxiensis]|uniref:Uncharacterized protein n=1 Tax=Lentzea jiangxiensis TaxID=641025 RepID=A0A1H0LPJ4_9PSEU|nr:hypothetical protein SAMN05421507_103396 [Lentzea jiangxiensis]
MSDDAPFEIPQERLSPAVAVRPELREDGLPHRTPADAEARLKPLGSQGTPTHGQLPRSAYG